MIKVICLITVSLALSGCHLNNIDSAKNEPQLELSTLDRRDNLIGVDLDKNGIRDDIDRFISTTFESDDAQIIVGRVARDLQKTLVVDLSSPEKIRLAKRNLDQSVIEMHNFFKTDDSPNNELLPTLQSLTSNTGLRFLASVKFADAVEKINPKSSTLSKIIKGAS